MSRTQYYTVLKDVKLIKKPFHVARAVAAKYFLAIKPKTVIGVTGSVGKTTTTKAVAAALGTSAISTLENLDSVFNIPITVLKSSKLKFLVLEMGVQYPGDMVFNTSIAPVDIAVFTRISPAHIQYLDSVDGIFAEKSKIISARTKLVIYNADDKILNERFKNLNIPKLSYGASADSDFRIEIGKETLKQTELSIVYKGESYKINTNLIGRHQSYSIAAAFAVAHHLGFDIKTIIDNLKNLRPADNRFNITKAGKADVIKDIYNSSPQALADAIDFVGRQKYTNKIIYLGDMLELGLISEKEHLTIAAQLLKSDFNQIYTFGPESQKIHNYLKKHNSKAKIEHLFKPKKIDKISYPSSTIILVKGSHGMHMENFFTGKRV